MEWTSVDPRPWRHLDSTVARALEARLDAVVEGLAQGVTASIPAFADIEDPRFLRDVQDAARVAVTRFVELAGTDDPALTPQVRAVYVGLGAAEAREERGPEVITAALRVASRLLLRESIQALGDLGEVPVEQTVLVAEAASAFVDDLVAACTDGFAIQVRELAGEHDRRRRNLAQLLLVGGASPDLVLASAAEIGWPGLDRVVPVLLPASEAREARFRFGVDGLVTDHGDHVVAVVRWGARVEHDLLGPRLHARAGVVVGPAVAWPDLPESVRMSESAARLLGPSQSPLWVEEHLVALALDGESAAINALVRRRLGPLDTLPATQRESLMITLESWLRHWGARGPVAQELFVHPQTVSYRIRRLHTLLGDDLDHPQRRLELLLALSRALGPREGAQQSS